MNLSFYFDAVSNDSPLNWWWSLIIFFTGLFLKTIMLLELVASLRSVRDVWLNEKYKVEMSLDDPQ